MDRRQFAILGLGLTGPLLAVRSAAAARPRVYRASEIAPLVKQLIVNQLGVDERQVTESASFVDDLGADSLDIVEMVLALEEVFEIEITDKDAESLTTVGRTIKYVTTTLKSKGRIRPESAAPKNASKKE